MITPLLPGSWIGVFGGGQLGRMLALEARRIGYRVCVLDPDPQCPTGQVADDQVVASYADQEAAGELARRVAVATYEFENVDATAVAAAERLGPVYPGSRVLGIVQNRLRQKDTLARLGFPIAAFHPIQTLPDLETGLQRVGLPAVLKTATSGYDGKGQVYLQADREAPDAYQALHVQSEMLVLEEYIPFSKELSVICAQDARGATACFPVVENIHRNRILDVTIAPARVSAEVSAAAQQLACSIMEKLDMVGLLAVELFLTQDETLLVNELAPRPHNSGHYTLDACATSQFEQLLRVICHLPLGSTDLLTPAVMVNLLGEVWLETNGQPNFAAALAVPGAKLHLYGKALARPGRKMGHICAVAPTVELALERALAARERATIPLRERLLP